ncbi:hypothetical protein LPN01_03930 [Sphingomonas sp. A2-49]|uniref:hypothetical protein n=1 Tax=Sphingomonas sp. A2-49 TaxID=1391375 RepID=UPI0021D2DBE8|nr:hypothetical protein [Sphingomonas sp. A2-49]MCU6453221.1 hypothetical protein [Sphingomonas sp. A2-49]
MAETKSLKEQNAWLIRAAMIAHIIAFVWIALEPGKLFKAGSVELGKRLEGLALPGSASLGIIVIASLLLLGLIPPDWRDRIIHLRWYNPLPGCRAFSVIGPKSSHVDMQALTARIGLLPNDPAAQNRLFYRLYKPLRDDIGVCDAHRRYLAARDIGTISALLVMPLPIMTMIVTHNAARSGWYGVLLLLTYLFSALAAKNYSYRMVQHVLALTAAQDLTSPATPSP